MLRANTRNQNKRAEPTKVNLLIEGCGLVATVSATSSGGELPETFFRSSSRSISFLHTQKKKTFKENSKQIENL